MIRHTQSLIGPNGNCLQTAIESVLNLPLGTLPPQAHPVAYYYRVLNNFLTTLGWHYRNVAPGAMLSNWTSQPLVEDDPDWGLSITCNDCADACCAICGHEPCPWCLNCCDHPDCLVDTQGLGIALKKTHTCSFTPCSKHRQRAACVALANASQQSPVASIESTSGRKPPDS